MTQEQYEALSLKELKTIAKEKELKGVSALKKSDLIAALMRQQKEEARKEQENRVMDTDETAIGILEVLPDGFGFIRCENYLPGENDVYVSHSQIRRFHLKTGDLLIGKKRPQKTTER